MNETMLYTIPNDYKIVVTFIDEINLINMPYSNNIENDSTSFPLIIGKEIEPLTCCEEFNDDNESFWCGIVSCDNQFYNLNRFKFAIVDKDGKNISLPV